MCGIFGLIIHKKADLEREFIKKSFKTLATLSESRGKDSSGLVFRNEYERKLQVIKGPVALNNLLTSIEVVKQLDGMIGAFCVKKGDDKNSSFAVMGHSRLVTNGSQLNEENNQPVIKDGIIGIHNGIIVNDTDLWAQFPEIEREFQIDSEVLFALIRKYLREGCEIAAAVSNTVKNVFGTVSAALFLEEYNTLVLTSNNRSLYYLTDENSIFAFASEAYNLEQVSKIRRINGKSEFRVKQVLPNDVVVLDLEQFRLLEFSPAIKVSEGAERHNSIQPYKIEIQSLDDGPSQRDLIRDTAEIASHPNALSQSSLLEFDIRRLQMLCRCSKCLLPETFPFIDYDEHGTCNYCNNYHVKDRTRPIEELFNLVEPYRRIDGEYDCIIPYSGGRDSTFTLHFAKKILGLNPVAFTYDWGMVNDLARRNIARVCGTLGVENIIVAADISMKRENIRKNILAWLRKPHLGMTPLFMAGDKYFFYYTDKIRKQTGIRLNIWGTNPLENTDFKVGFLGVSPDFYKKRIYSLSAKRQAKLFSSVGKIILSNPSYLNSSVWDTFGSFLSRSVVPHRDYYHLFDYFRWDEEEIEKLVLEEYRWETAIDTKTTWRIGDGTAAFYNYIYCSVAGFSEYDTFRSNQIREGMISRDEGMRLVMEENQPRYASIKWYLDIVGIDYESTIKIINNIPRLYH